jgi:hypothetical protein
VPETDRPSDDVDDSRGLLVGVGRAPRRFRPVLAHQVEGRGVRARAEHRPGARQDDDADRRILPQPPAGAQQPVVGRVVDRVAPLGPVEPHLGDAVAHLDKDAHAALAPDLLIKVIP